MKLYLWEQLFWGPEFSENSNAALVAADDRDLCFLQTFEAPTIQTYVFYETFETPTIQTYVFYDTFEWAQAASAVLLENGALLNKN